MVNRGGPCFSNLFGGTATDATEADAKRAAAGGGGDLRHQASLGHRAVICQK
jgi:hypothetical protein